ncbi:MAG: amino acid--tRNA ligase-related protein, partial [Parcubacteria group bacterium]
MKQQRSLVRELSKAIDKEVCLLGRVLAIRKLGNISFVLVQDYSGTVQTVWDKQPIVKVQDAVSVVGTVRQDKRAKSGVELKGRELQIISGTTEELPLDLSKSELKLQLRTLLDQRPLSLRHPKQQAIFKVYDVLLKAYAEALRAEGFTEIKTPKILAAVSEGGANFFKIGYFGKSAYLAQSQQFYKQL